MIDVAAQADQRHGRELLSFRLAGQDFCIDISSVREIRGWAAVTPLPNAPEYVKGVVNLRGAVLPIVDLASKLGLPSSDPTPQHVIIVVQAGSQIIGLLVDAVNDILMITDDMIQPTPPIASAYDLSYVTGLISIDDKMLSMLELEQILPPPESRAA